MSRVLRSGTTNAAASVGGFVLSRNEAAFRPRDAAPGPTNDFEPTGFSGEAEPVHTPADPYELGIAEGRRVAGAKSAGRSTWPTGVAPACPYNQRNCRESFLR